MSKAGRLPVIKTAPEKMIPERSRNGKEIAPEIRRTVEFAQEQGADGPVVYVAMTEQTRSVKGCNLS